MRLQHLRRNQLEILTRNLQMPVTERVSPMRLVPDESQPLDQGPDGNINGIVKANIAAIRDEAGKHLELVHLVPDHLADGSELLAQRVLAEFLFGRIIDEAIAHRHAFERL